MLVFCLHVCLCIMSVTGDKEGHKRVSDLLELTLPQTMNFLDYYLLTYGGVLTCV